jgi:hypothetical protein
MGNLPPFAVIYGNGTKEGGRRLGAAIKGQDTIAQVWCPGETHKGNAPGLAYVFDLEDEGRVVALLRHGRTPFGKLGGVKLRTIAEVWSAEQLPERSPLRCPGCGKRGDVLQADVITATANRVHPTAIPLR